MPDPQYLLTSKQVAHFVADGYLAFEGLVPDHRNQAALKAFQENKHGDLWKSPVIQSPTIRTRIPILAAAIWSAAWQN